MKKIYSVAAVVATIMMNAQTGLVGVNTNSPTNTLDVNGTARVRALLPNTFVSGVDKIVVADAFGVLKSVPESAISATRSYEVLFDFNTLNPTSITDSDQSASTARTPVTIQSQNIRLDKEALVQINFSVPVDKVYAYNSSTAPSDGRSKMLRSHLFVDNVEVTRSTNAYTNYVNPTEPTPPPALAGIFFNTGSYFIKLSAGTHTIRLDGTCNPYITCLQGGSIPGTRFQAVALY